MLFDNFSMMKLTKQTSQQEEDAQESVEIPKNLKKSITMDDEIFKLPKLTDKAQ